MVTAAVPDRLSILGIKRLFIFQMDPSTASITAAHDVDTCVSSGTARYRVAFDPGVMKTLSEFADYTRINRRKFLLTGAMASAATWFGSRAAAQGAAAESGNPITSLIRESADAEAGLPPLAPTDKQPPGLEIREPQRKLGWAIVGLGKLSVEEILPAFGSCYKSRPTALVSGHPDKARQLAEVYGIPPGSVYTYETFDRLKDNPEVDVVYVVIPNSMHAEYTIRGFKAGKHVLCEKPMAVSTAECEAMIAAAGEASRKLGIAYRLHYEPMNKAVMELCKKKPYGNIKTFFGSNCQSVDAPNIRLSGSLGGGPVGDVGIYCINAARYTIGEEPIEAVALETQPKSDPRFREVPETVNFLLRYPSGVLAACECSFGTGRSSSYEVLCEKGSITMDPAYSYQGLRLWTESQEEGVPVRKEMLMNAVDQFASEMDAFSVSVEKNEPFPTSGEMGLKDMRIVLAVLESARLGGQPVRVA
jgi:predicted dehydrogenase